MQRAWWAWTPVLKRRAPCGGRRSAVLWRRGGVVAAIAVEGGVASGNGTHCGPQGRVRRVRRAVGTSCASEPMGQKRH